MSGHAPSDLDSHIHAHGSAQTGTSEHAPGGSGSHELEAQHTTLSNRRLTSASTRLDSQLRFKSVLTRVDFDPLDFESIRSGSSSVQCDFDRFDFDSTTYQIDSTLLDFDSSRFRFDV